MEQRIEGTKLRGLVSRARELGRLQEQVVDSAADGVEAGDAYVTVIESSVPRTHVELRELWRARDLAFAFAWRDVKVRYKQSMIGIGWAILQPFLTMVIFTLIFGKFAKFPSQGLPYPVFVFLGLLAWGFFSSALTQISASVMTNRALVQKVYFPRLILPMSGVLVPTVDFMFSFVVLIGIMLWYHVGFHLTILFAPLFLLLIAVTAMGVGAVFATINARYRDVPYAIPFVIQIWMYVSPVIYPTESLPHKWQVLTSFNPVVGAVTGFRWAVAGTPAPSTFQLGVGVGVALLFLLAGFSIYRAWEYRFADTI